MRGAIAACGGSKRGEVPTTVALTGLVVLVACNGELLNLHLQKLVQSFLCDSLKQFCDKLFVEKMQNMEIKQYTKERIPNVIQFERDLRTEEDFWGREIDEAYIADVTASFEELTFSDSLSLLADLDGKVVGQIDCALLHSHFDGSVKVYLDWICIIQSHRHQGVARGLMTALRRELHERGIDTLIGLIASSKEARQFYRSLPNAEIKNEEIWIDS